MTYTDKPHSQRYTGRGLGWARKPLRKRQARRIARYRAGLILDSVLAAGWSPADLEKRFGEEGTEMISTQLYDIAQWLTATGDPDGEPTR